MRRLLPVAMLLSIAVAPSLFRAPAAIAAEVAADSTVTAVTVYPDRARVTRRAEVALPVGESVVVIGGLPAGAGRDTVQVATDAEVSLTILGVEARRAFLTEVASERERAIRAELQAAGDRHQGLVDKITALEEQANFIRSVAKVSPPKTKEGMLVGQPADWSAAWTAVGKGMEATLKAKREQEVAMRRVGDDIRRLEKELSRVQTGAAERTEVRIPVRAGAAGPAAFEVTYEVADASWRPAYDARLDPEKASLELTLNAQVRQRTGEDWNGVALTLSTAHPGAAAAMREPSPWFIGFEHPAATDFFAKSLREEKDVATSGIAGALASRAPAEPTMEIAHQVVGEFALAYRIPGTVVVPADAEPHQYAADRRVLPVRLEVRTHPRVEPVAYLYAVLTNTETPLPAGEVSLYRGGARVGRAPMAAVRPGEERRLAFGADDRVRVAYNVDTDQGGSAGLFGGKRRFERRYVVEVGNFHDRPVEVSVYDRLPVPQDEAIEIKYLDDWATAPTERDVEGRKGVVVWKDGFEAGERRKIRFGYAVSFPKDERLVGF